MAKHSHHPRVHLAMMQPTSLTPVAHTRDARPPKLMTASSAQLDHGIRHNVPYHVDRTLANWHHKLIKWMMCQLPSTISKVRHQLGLTNHLTDHRPTHMMMIAMMITTNKLCNTKLSSMDSCHQPSTHDRTHSTHDMSHHSDHRLCSHKCCSLSAPLVDDATSVLWTHSQPTLHDPVDVSLRSVSTNIVPTLLHHSGQPASHSVVTSSRPNMRLCSNFT